MHHKFLLNINNNITNIKIEQYNMHGSIVFQPLQYQNAPQIFKYIPQHNITNIKHCYIVYSSKLNFYFCIGRNRITCRSTKRHVHCMLWRGATHFLIMQTFILRYFDKQPDITEFGASWNQNLQQATNRRTYRGVYKL